MKTNLLTFALLLVTLTITAQQPTQKVATKYMRPSVSKFYFEPKDRAQTMVINQFKALDISAKFNNHKVDFPNLIVEVTDEAAKKSRVDVFAGRATNPIMAKWWNRDQNGDFNYDYVAQSGLYSSTDADAVMARGSSIDRREMMGEELIGKTYILVYEIADLITMEQKYDRQDAANKNLGIDKPVERNYEGYEIKYNVYAYKMIYNDSVASVFFNEYWTDKNNHDQAKVIKWAAAKFPVEYIQKVSGTMQSTQLKKQPLTSTAKKKTIDELLLMLPAKIQEQSLFDLTYYIPDFNLKATIFSTKPLQAKLGTKESLYLDERFFVYEIELDEQGNQLKNLKGVVRAKKIEDNMGVATGESTPSTFTQQGGKRLYEGMLIESKEDIGGILNAGLSLPSADRSFGGLYVGLDYRLSRIIKKRGVYVGVDFTANYMNDVNPGIVRADGYTLADGSTYFSGFTYSFAAKISKEMYFTRRGNIYLNPSVGLGMVVYSFNKSGNKTIEFTVTGSDGKSKHNPDYAWSSFYAPLSLGLGFYIKPSMSVELRPIYRIKLAASTGEGNRLEQSGSPTPNWGFEKIDQLTMPAAVVLNWRLRF